MADRQAGTNRFVHVLIVTFIALVLGFDLLSIYLPRVAAIPVHNGGTLTWGILGAYLLVLLIVLAAVYYAFHLPQGGDSPGEKGE